MVLQYSKYKTKKQYGFLQFYLNDKHSKLIIQFLKIRVWMFPNPQSPSHNYLFSDHKGKALLRVGKYFTKYSTKLFTKK